MIILRAIPTDALENFFVMSFLLFVFPDVSFIMPRISFTLVRIYFFKFFFWSTKVRSILEDVESTQDI